MAKLSKSAIETVLKGKNSKDTAKLAQEIFDILKSGAKVQEDREALTSQQYDKMKASLDALMTSESTRTENLRMMRDLQEEKIYMEDKEIDALKEKLEQTIKLGETEEGEIFLLKTTIEALIEANEARRRNNESMEEAAAASDRVADGLKKTIGYTDDYRKSMTGSVIDMAVMFDTAEGGYDELVASLKKTVTAEGLVFNAMEKVRDSMLALAMASYNQMKALDEQQVGFRKTTGLGKEYDQMMKDTYEANKLNGVSVEENAKAMGDLAKGMSDFTMLGTKQQKMLTETAGILQENGIASETFAANTQIMNKGLSMGAEDAAQFNTTMVAMAKDIGMAPQELADGFGELAGTMTALSGGSEAAQTAMRGLSATSKATGIAMGRIVDITSQFDTFEGASESVGALNAMLGGDFINAMDVMAAEDPAERFGMMQQALDDAGKSFDDMTYYEKKAIAESMGLKDTNELAMLMSGNMDQLAGDFGKTSDEIVAMEKAAKANQSVQESFQQLLSEMAPTFQSLIDGVRGIVEALQKLGPLLPYTGAALGFLGVALTGAYMHMRLLDITGKATGMSFKALGKAGFAAGMKVMLGFAAFVLLGVILYKVYKTLGPLAGGFALLGIAAVLLGAKILLGLTAATGGLYLIIPAVIAGVAGLIGIFSAVSKKVGGFSQYFMIAAQPFIELFNEMKKTVGILVEALAPLWKILGKVGGAFMSLFPGGASGGSILTNTFKVIAFLLKGMLMPLTALLKVIGGIGSFVGGAISLMGFEDGGTAPGGPIIVGEGGPEIISPPKGTQITPNPGSTVSSMLSSIGSGFGNMFGGGATGGAQEVNLNVTLELDGRELGNYIKKVTLPMMNPVAGGG